MTGFDLPGITEEASGRPTITVTNATLEGEGASNVTIPSQTINGGTWSVTAGKLNLTLNTPSTQAVSTWLSNDGRHFVGSVDGENVVTISDNTAQITSIKGLRYRANSIDYYVERAKYETDEETYIMASGIAYVYVSKDVTLNRGQKQGGLGDSATVTVTYSAFTLPLKTGWNLVQIDEELQIYEDMKPTSGTMAVKIANRNVPWTIKVK
ncbi:MAG: hypothetical protein LBT13_10545 [Treponema sp.]|jgi:hypothetical protein|nr:hypothetical protein [Treponema sp.]